ncbi:MAG: helix-turn-helix domain-containing protein [Candidatus Thorarchaeota archaeon]
MKRNWRLQLLMELCSLGQNELAQLAGMDKAALSRIMSGQKQASPRQKTSLVQVLERRLSNVKLDSSQLFEA